MKVTARATGDVEPPNGRGHGMVIDTTELAQELRRRRVGRPALVDSLAGTRGSTWVPGDLEHVPSSLLVLAAMSLTNSQTPR